jgi:hypothetical protein
MTRLHHRKQGLAPVEVLELTSFQLIADAPCVFVDIQKYSGYAEQG